MNLGATYQIGESDETVWIDKYLLFEPRYSNWGGRGEMVVTNNPMISGNYLCLLF